MRSSQGDNRIRAPGDGWLPAQRRWTRARASPAGGVASDGNRAGIDAVPSDHRVVGGARLIQVGGVRVLGSEREVDDEHLGLEAIGESSGQVAVCRGAATDVVAAVEVQHVTERSGNGGPFARDATELVLADLSTTHVADADDRRRPAISCPGG